MLVNECFAADLDTICPNLGDVAIFRYMGFTFDMNGAVTLVYIDMASIRNVERRIQGDAQFVFGFLRLHFFFGWAISPHEFILAVNGHVRVDGGYVIVAKVLGKAGYAFKICVIAVFL